MLLRAIERGRQFLGGLLGGLFASWRTHSLRVLPLLLQMLDRVFEMLLVTEVFEEILQRPPSNAQPVTV